MTLCKNRLSAAHLGLSTRQEGGAKEMGQGLILDILGRKRGSGSFDLERSIVSHHAGHNDKALRSQG